MPSRNPHSSRVLSAHMMTVNPPFISLIPGPMRRSPRWVNLWKGLSGGQRVSMWSARMTGFLRPAVLVKTWWLANPLPTSTTWCANPSGISRATARATASTPLRLRVWLLLSTSVLRNATILPRFFLIALRITAVVSLGLLAGRGVIILQFPGGIGDFFSGSPTGLQYYWRRCHERLGIRTGNRISRTCGTPCSGRRTAGFRTWNWWLTGRWRRHTSANRSGP